MKKIDNVMAEKFIDAEPRSFNNTKVTVEDWVVRMYLHWNNILSRPLEKKTDLTLNVPLDWQTKTTKSRINTVFEMMAMPIKIVSKKTVWLFEQSDWSHKDVLPWLNFVHM